MRRALPGSRRALTCVTETELFATSGGIQHRRRKQAGAGQRCGRADQGPVRAEGGRPGGAQPSTALAATTAWSTWTWARRTPTARPRCRSSCTWNTPTDAVLYVPVSQLHHISRYTGVTPRTAPLHSLGSGQWEKAKRKAAEQVRDARRRAAEHLRAPRGAPGPRLPPRARRTTKSFANDFGFEETADQKAAIHAVIHDMVSPQPMDRLVCGDVGFGKTEVALRAAFVAAMGGKQVAFLAPTTLAGRAALPDADRPLCQVAGAGGRGLALSHRQGGQRGAARVWPMARWTSWSARTSCCPKSRQVQEPGPAHHRRGAPLWRAPQGGDEGHARRGRCAHAHRHAHPAHHGHGAGRPARSDR